MRLNLTLIAALCLAACGSDGSNTPADAGDGDGDGDGDAGVPDANLPDPRLMYISTGSGQSLAVARLEGNGTITALSNMNVDLAANTGAMAYARTARRIYIGTGQNITTLSLDAAGTPTVLGSTNNTGTPTYLALADNEQFLISAYFGLDSLASHDATGDPPHVEIELLSTDDEPHASYIGPGGRVYVPHRNGETTHWYGVDALGELEFQGELETGGNNIGPRHIAFSSDETIAYVVNEFDDSVTAHNVGVDGSLTAFQTITTIPAGFDPANNTCADVHVSPDGNYLYASNRGHNSLAMFSIGGDGTLTPLGNVDTEDTPREFDISPSGEYVVVAGQGSGFLQSYSVNGDGTLTAVGGDGRFNVGGDPRWVIID